MVSRHLHCVFTGHILCVLIKAYFSSVAKNAVAFFRIPRSSLSLATSSSNCLIFCCSSVSQDSLVFSRLKPPPFRRSDLSFQFLHDCSIIWPGRRDYGLQIRQPYSLQHRLSFCVGNQIIATISWLVMLVIEFVILYDKHVRPLRSG